jgi:antitoxin VapB
MTAHTTKTFRSGNSEAVRLPKDIGFGEGVEVEVVRDGDSVTIRRKRMSNRDLVAMLRQLPKPASVQAREPFEVPDRPGL